MKYAETGQGNYADDDSLEAIEEDKLPGTSAIGTVGVNTGGPDGSDTHFNAGESGRMVDLVPPDPETPFEALDFRDGFGGNKMSLSSKIAYVMENGEPLCNHCETRFIPNALGKKMACTNCGCLKPNDDHGVTAGNFEHVEGPTIGDLDRGSDIVKEEVKTGATETLMDYFKTAGNDSELYYSGYADAQAGKPLDEDLALLSKDYYSGYQQYKFYNKTPQQSEGQTLFDIKPNSNSIPRGNQERSYEEVGPHQLTASKQPFPVDVIQKFFEV